MFSSSRAQWQLCLLLSLNVLPAFSLNLTTFQPSLPLAPSPLPAAFASQNADQLYDLFSKLGRSTNWNLVQSIQLQGNTYEPEGMVRIGTDRFFISGAVHVVEPLPYGRIINGTDRANGSGYGYIAVYSGNGTQIARATYNNITDLEYHLGGIDYDGQYVWATLAQYRPNSTATILRINPNTLEATNMQHITDHEGAIVHDTNSSQLFVMNWGGRNASTFSDKTNVTWPQFTRPKAVSRNPSYYIDYQDCKYVGRPRGNNGRATAACSGIAGLSAGSGVLYLGGIALVDLDTMVPIIEVPITLRTAANYPMTVNPFDIAVFDGKLRAYWAPDNFNTTIYVYEASLNGTFQYGGNGGTAESSALWP